MISMGTDSFVLMIFILSVLAYGLAIGMVNMSREIKLHRRSGINYSNYKKYRTYFDFKVNIPVIVLNATFFVMDVIMCLLSVNREMLKLYLIPLIMALIIVAFTLYMFISCSRYNRDLSDFDTYYENIKSSYVNKDLINTNIVKIEEKKNFIYRRIESLNEECSKVFASHSQITNSEQCLEQLLEVEREQKSLLTSFEDNTSKLFTNALQKYLQNKGKADANSFIFNSNYAVDVDALTNNALAQLKELFREYVIKTYIDNPKKNLTDFEMVADCLNHLEDFKDYYSIITEASNSRSLIEENLSQLNEVKNEISKQVEGLLESLSKLFPNVTIRGTEKAYEELQTYIDKNNDVLNKYDESMITLSIQLLTDYGSHKAAVKENYSILSYVSNIDYDSIRKNAQDTVNALFKGTVVKLFASGHHQTSGDLLRICDCLLRLDALDEKNTEILLGYIAVDPVKYQSVIDFIFEKNLATYRLLLLCNGKGYDWIYCRSVNSILNFNQLTELMADILTKDLSKIANRYLLMCDKNDISYIKNAINVANVKNQTSVLVQNYVSLLQLDGGFNMSSTRYENIALVLRYYYINTTGKKNDSIETIISQEEFYESKDLLDKQYSKELFNIEPVLMKTFRSLLYYSLYCSKSYGLLREEKIKELYAEYKRTLNVKGLTCLGALLDAIMVINITDRTIQETVMTNIEECKKIQYYDDFYPLTANKQNNYKLYGRDIIRNMIEEHFDVLAPVINHIEKDRLFIDKIRFA